MTLPQFSSGLGGAVQDMVLMGRHLTASEMLAAGLVTQTFFPGRLMEEVIPRMKRACGEQNLGLQWNKLLLKQHQKSQVSLLMLVDKLPKHTFDTTVCAGGASDRRGDGAADGDVELQTISYKSCQLYQYGKVPSVPETVVKN